MENVVKHSVIVKSNSLVSAVYKMPVNSSHLFNIMLRYITANDVINDDGKLHTITAIEFGKLLNINSKHQYRELKIATKFLLSAVIRVPIDSLIYDEYSIFDTARYAIGDGYTSLAFSRNFLPFIQNLKGDYTRLKLAETLSLKNFYSVRLYEKFMQFMEPDGTGWWNVEIDELKKLLSIDENHTYWNNNFFRIKVFSPAIAEIVSKLYWNISVNPVRAGRKIFILEIKFCVLDKQYSSAVVGNKKTRLNAAARAADTRAKISKLAHHKKIGIS